jgi:colicin import membrane protein
MAAKPPDGFARPPQGPSSVLGPPSVAFNPDQRRAYRQRLVGAELTAERLRALATRHEAERERQTHPLEAARRVAIADARLAFIRVEQRQRSTLARAKLSDGRTGEQLAVSLAKLSTAALERADAELRARPTREPASADDKIRQLAFSRERDRRAAARAAKAQAAELARLSRVKLRYAQGLRGKSKAALVQEVRAQSARLEEAQESFVYAQGRLARALTADKPAAQRLFEGAAAKLRTEHAKAAVLATRGRVAGRK